MVISLCVPCMNRTHDLKRALPEIIRAANTSPPVEIVVLNYDSKDDLDDFMKVVLSADLLVQGNFFTYVKITDKRYYNSPHARNLAVLASHGEYFIMMAADMLPTDKCVKFLRYMIEAQKPVWMCEGYMGRLIVCRKDEFISAGGYDERFKYYAPEDKDICMRLHRRGGKFIQFSPNIVSEIPTKYRDKLRNLDLTDFQGEGQIRMAMARVMQPIYEDNCAKGVLVANPEGWGKE